MTFSPNYPGAIVVPAHPANWRTWPNTPKGWVLHTPEETADSYPGTPYWFQTPNIDASTHYFVAYDGRIFQMVEERYSPIANGVLGKPYPAWADPRISLNSQSLNVEIEGRAASIHWTLVRGGVQWASLVRLIRARGNFPKDREHVIGHYQVANNRSDPGALFPWDALIADLAPKQEEEDMKLVWCPDRVRAYLIGPQTVKWVTSAGDVAALEKLYGKIATALSGAEIDSLEKLLEAP